VVGQERAILQMCSSSSVAEAASLPRLLRQGEAEREMIVAPVYREISVRWPPGASPPRPREEASSHHAVETVTVEMQQVAAQRSRCYSVSGAVEAARQCSGQLERHW